MEFTTSSSSPSSSSSLPVVTFVTGNAKKLEEFIAIMSSGEKSLPFRVVSATIDLPELQGEPEFVSKEKCRLAAMQIGGPVIVEDTSLCYNALGGLPGVYIKWFLDKLGHQGLNNLLLAYPDKSAYAQCIFSFCDGSPTGDINKQEVFVGQCHGSIVPARGPNSFGWDPVFQPDGFGETFAEMNKEIKNTISHRSKSVALLKAYLLEKYAER
jgi:inosine triphosphate pyrophosphatase